MSAKHELHLAYVLHTRPYRETSLLVEMFSREHGRISLVARGAKRGKSNTLLQLFAPLTVSWYGSGELVTLTNLESAGVRHDLQAKRAICGLYINELLVKLLHKWDPCANLFDCYQNVLSNLVDNQASEQISLRGFEKQLIKSLGYGLQLTREVDSGALVQAERNYLFDPVLGPRLVNDAHISGIKGSSLLAFAADCFDNTAVLSDIKRLMRIVITHHLGTRQLMARELL